MLSKKKQLLFEKQAEVVKAIAHPLRIAILDFLNNGEQCVCGIAQHLGSGRSNISRHLSVMAGAGVLDHRKEGLKVIYTLKTPCILELLSCVTNVLKSKSKENERLLKAL